MSTVRLPQARLAVTDTIRRAGRFSQFTTLNTDTAFTVNKSLSRSGLLEYWSVEGTPRSSWQGWAGERTPPSTGQVTASKDLMLVKSNTQWSGQHHCRMRPVGRGQETLEKRDAAQAPASVDAADGAVAAWRVRSKSSRSLFLIDSKRQTVGLSLFDPVRPIVSEEDHLFSCQGWCIPTAIVPGQV
jgi:hypothetical protein